MRVNVRGKNKFEPTDAIRAYAENKLQKLSVYFKKADEVEAFVLCKVYDAHQTVEITIPTKHLILRAEVKDETIYSAIDLAIDKIETQLKKHKSKIYKSIKSRVGLGDYYGNNNEELDMDLMKSEIMLTNFVKEKEIKLEPMTPEDAVVQMEMLGHTFYIFLNSENSKVSVVYLREDNDYGIIETNK